MVGGSQARGDPAALPLALTSEPASWGSVWADVARSPGAYYEQLDVDLARRAGAGLWTIGGTYTFAVLATRQLIPAVAWLLAFGVASVVLTTRLRRTRSAGRDLLWATDAGVALVAFAQWLGGGELALGNALLPAAIFASATQPPRRAALVLVTVGALAASATRHDPERAPLSVSIGCAELRGNMTAEEVFAAADADLLAAKAARPSGSAS